MSIEVEVYGNEQIPGHKSNVIEYSYSEEATPVIPGDSSGGIGSISFSTLDDAATSMLMYGDTAHLFDSHNGSITGKIESVNGSDGVASFSGVSDLVRLNILGDVPFMDSTLGIVVETIFATAGILAGFDIDDTLASIPVISPEYSGDLWVFLKELCTAYEFEITLIDDVITVRPLRQNTINLFDTISDSWSVSGANQAQTVEVNYYNYASVTNELVYPKGGWTKDVQVYQVDAAQTLTIDLKLDYYLSSVTQPVLQDTVGRYDTGSVYCVAGNDGLPITAAEWSAYGGSLNVAIDPDDSSLLHVTIVGANLTDIGPFRIAVSAGPSDYYSSLRITGTGLAFDKQTISVPTGLTADETSSKVGITIDNKFISTKAQAYDAGKRAILQYGMPKVGYSFSAPNIGDFLTAPGTILYTHFFEYDEQVGTELFSQVDSSIGTWDFTKFDDHLSTSIVDGVTYQMFGNVNGSRIKYRDSWYRVRSANITPTTVDASADWDNLFDDFNTVNTDNTFTTFNGTFDQLTFTDFHLVPMRSA
jgi:hypothetical protein